MEEEEGGKSLPPEPARKHSPATAALEQQKAGAASGGSGRHRPFPQTPRRTTHRGLGGRGGGQGGREQAAGELAPSEHLGFVVLGVWPTWWKSLVDACEHLWDHRMVGVGRDLCGSPRAGCTGPHPGGS